MTPLEVVQQTSATVGSVGAAFYFHPDTLARGKAAGLDGFRMYVLGRGGPLGDVESDVVVSAFGYFAPGLVAKIWTSAKEIMSPRDAGTLYMECAAALGTATLSGVDGLGEFNTAAEKVIDAVDRSALALFAAVAAEPRTDDPAGRAYQNIVVLRELRGSVHLLALAAQGLRAETAHRIKRPDDVATFGWPTEIEPTSEERAQWDAAEALTDQLLVAPYSVLGDDEAAALVTVIEAAGAAFG